VTPATCRNCDAPLTGPYCAQCGQHAHDSARSLGALCREAWHVITHVDGRLWATLWLLLVRPGQLTLEYFAEHRARFVPPVRLYLVISIVFFGLASLSSAWDREVVVTNKDDRQKIAGDVAEIKREARQAAREARQAAGTADAPAAAGAATADSDDGDFTFDIYDLKDCGKIHSSVPWLERGLRDACRRNVGDHGRTLRHAFVANIPKMMFVFLPLMAVAMLLLYWFPRRYYVEHLVFFLHDHAALFLAMTLQLLLGAAAQLLPALQTVASTAALAVFFYALWYVYRSMRRYYGQGRTLTLAKLSLVSLTYFVFLGVTLLVNLFVSALIA
jgi:hypothetical protein